MGKRIAVSMVYWSTLEGYPLASVWLGDGASGALLDDEDLAELARDIATVRGEMARALGTGRGAGISANVGAIEKLVNTEAMDGRTCEECAAADGVEVDPSDAAEVALYAPYYKCEGGDRCRGQLIPVVRN